MNQQQRLEHRRAVLDNINFTSQRHINCIRINSHNTKRHEQKKLDVASYCLQQGWHFICEAEFKDGKRADVVILDIGLIVEIETDLANWEKKKEEYKYPFIERVVVIDPNRKFKVEMLW
ncbi:MAG: hypothetical protein ACE5H1_00310 [Thermodesulfobacteriota bacterium]